MGCGIKASTGAVALLGYPVGHSFSPQMHNAAFLAAGLDLVYLAFAVQPEDLGVALQGCRALGLRGANVTVPHKQAVMKYLDEIDPLAAQIGAVNTVVNKNGCLKGYNTDASGFLRSLEEQGFNLRGKKVIVLGAGGAARAVAFALVDAGCGQLTIANRTLEKAEALAASLREYGVFLRNCRLGSSELALMLKESDLVVNATSSGMEPYAKETPIPAELLPVGCWVYDLVYNPPKTRLLQMARQRGCRIIPGMSMLLYQGAEAFKLWTGETPPLSVMVRALQEAGSYFLSP